MLHINGNNALGLQHKLREITSDAEELRRKGIDCSFSEFLETKFKDGAGNPVTKEVLFADLGINTNLMTIENLISSPYETKWLVPEIIRDYIREGLRKAPIYPNLIRGEEIIGQPNMTIPSLAMSGDATMDATAEAQTIGTGTVSWGSRTVKVSKVAKGIQFTYESMMYTSLNLVGVFFEDVGVRLGYSLDANLISTLINGDQADSSMSAPSIGVNSTTDKITYYDLLRMWVRGGIIGRNWRSVVGNEAAVLAMMNLAEFKNRQASANPYPMDFKVPIVTNPEMFAHISVPDNKIIMVDKDMAIMQLTSAPLMIESEKIVSRQINGTYASLTTGFAKLFRDGAIVVDGGTAFSGAGFPSWMVTGYTS